MSRAPPPPKRNPDVHAIAFQVTNHSSVMLCAFNCTTDASVVATTTMHALLSSYAYEVHVHTTVVSQTSTLRTVYTSRIQEQGSPQEKFKAKWVGVVWVEFVTTSVIRITTSKKNWS